MYPRSLSLHNWLVTHAGGLESTLARKSFSIFLTAIQRNARRQPGTQVPYSGPSHALKYAGMCAAHYTGKQAGGQPQTKPHKEKPNLAVAYPRAMMCESTDKVSGPIQQPPDQRPVDWPTADDSEPLMPISQARPCPEETAVLTEPSWKLPAAEGSAHTGPSPLGEAHPSVGPSPDQPALGRASESRVLPAESVHLQLDVPPPVEPVPGQSLPDYPAESRYFQPDLPSAVDPTPEASLAGYPIPINPYPSDLAHRTETKRAELAELAAQLGPAIGRESVLFEDEWMVIVDKPCGVYCEHVLASMPHVFGFAPYISGTVHESRQTARETARANQATAPQKKTAQSQTALSCAGNQDGIVDLPNEAVNWEGRAGMGAAVPTIGRETTESKPERISVQGNWPDKEERAAGREVGGGTRAVQKGQRDLTAGAEPQGGRQLSSGRRTRGKPLSGPKDKGAPRLPLQFHLANRLDRDTSGVIVVAKSSATAGKLGTAFARRQVKKTYVALCCGPMPAWRDRVVVTGHGRSRHGMWRVYDQSDVGRSLPGKSVVREMATELAVIGRWGGEALVGRHEGEGEREGEVRTGGGTAGPPRTCESRPRVEEAPCGTVGERQELLGARGEWSRVMSPSSPERRAESFASEASCRRDETDGVGGLTDLAENDKVNKMIDAPKCEAKKGAEVEAAIGSTNRSEADSAAAIEVGVCREATSTNTNPDETNLGSEFVLLRASLITGRTHQIRLHCQHVGLPLMGDVRYGGPQIWQFGGQLWDAHALHSAKLSFTHPMTGARIEVQAPLPDWAKGCEGTL